MRKVNRLFRMLRGPWGTGKFGKMMAEARDHLIKLIEPHLNCLEQHIINAIQADLILFTWVSSDEKAVTNTLVETTTLHSTS